MFKRFPPFLLVACISGIIAGGISYLSHSTDVEQEVFHAQSEQYDIESPELLLDLKGYWKFSRGDNQAWSAADFYDSDWGEIRVGLPWEGQGHRDYDGFAWYRKHITIPQGAIKGDLSLELGQIDDADEVFFNGTLVGSSGNMPPNYNTAYQENRQYLISSNLVKWSGENVIAVRVYDGGKDGGIRKGKSGLFTTPPKPIADIDLTGVWEFVLEPELNELGEGAVWTNIIVPGNWEDQGFRDYDGFAWYRKTIVVPETYKGSSFVLLMGKIDDLDQVFIDGVKVASTGTMYENHGEILGKEWKALRGYYLPSNSIQLGKQHEISVRVYDSHGGGGIYEGPVGIITQQHYTEFWKNNRKQND